MNSFFVRTFQIAVVYPVAFAGSLSGLLDVEIYTE